MVKNHGFEGDVEVKIPRFFNKPRQVTVNILRDEWNNNEQIIKLKKYINELSIKNSWKAGGSLEQPPLKVSIYDCALVPPQLYKTTLTHEIVGHVFWHTHVMHTPKYLKCQTYLSKLPPLTTYVEFHQSSFKSFDLIDNYDMYADEQHSALADIVHSGGSPSWITLMEGKELEKHTDFFKKLHNI